MHFPPTYDRSHWLDENWGRTRNTFFARLLNIQFVLEL